MLLTDLDKSILEGKVFLFANETSLTHVGVLLQSLEQTAYSETNNGIQWSVEIKYH